MGECSPSVSCSSLQPLLSLLVRWEEGVVSGFSPRPLRPAMFPVEGVWHIS